MLGVGDKIQKNLDELVGVADDSGKIGLGAEVDFNVVAAERMFVQLERALDEIVDVEELL